LAQASDITQEKLDQSKDAAASPTGPELATQGPEATSTGEKVMPKFETPFEVEPPNEKHHSKPETPLLDKKGHEFAAPKIGSQKPSSAIEDYYREKSNYQVLHLGPRLASGVTFCPYSKPSPSSAASASTCLYTSDSLVMPTNRAKAKAGLAFRRAGYHQLSKSTQLQPADPRLRRMEEIEKWYNFEQSAGKDAESLVTLVDIQGRVTRDIKCSDFVQHYDIINGAHDLHPAKEQAARLSRVTLTKEAKGNDKPDEKATSQSDETQIDEISGSQCSDCSVDLSKRLLPM